MGSLKKGLTKQEGFTPESCGPMETKHNERPKQRDDISRTVKSGARKGSRKGY